MSNIRAGLYCVIAFVVFVGVPLYLALDGQSQPRVRTNTMRPFSPSNQAGGVAISRDGGITRSNQSIAHSTGYLEAIAEIRRIRRGN